MSSVSTTASDQGGSPFLAISSDSRLCREPISSSGMRVVVMSISPIGA
jgi:hypothetical protein